MTARVVRVAVLAFLLALVLPAASRTLPTDGSYNHGRVFLATCQGGVHPCADLDVSQGDTPDPVPAGDPLIYRIKLQNHGPDAAPAVTLTDQLPDGVVCDSITTNVDPPLPPGTAPSCNPPEGAACFFNSDSGSINCFFGTLENTDQNPSPGPRIITITVHYVPTDPPPDYPRKITNTAFPNSDGASDPDGSNNRSLEETTILSPGDLKITKTHASDPVPPSNIFVYQLRLDNTAKAPTLDPNHTGVPHDAITVTDTLPHGFVFAGTAPDPGHPGVVNDCSATSVGALQNSIVTCHPQTSIAPGDPYLLNLQINPTETGTFTNFAQVDKYGGDPTLGDNSSSDLTHVVCGKPGPNGFPILCVTKTDSEDPVPEGKPFTYSIKVQNERNGVEDAFNEPVRVVDTLPPGMVVQSVAISGAGGSCAPQSGQTLTCTTNPGIPRGGSVTIAVTVIAFQVGSFENVACIFVRGDGTLERLSCANQPTTITAAADLAITKTGSPNPVEVNSDLTYTMKVTNKGPAAVPNVQFDDSVPANTTFISSDPASPTCDLSTPDNVHCNLGDMAPGTTKTVIVVVRPTLPGTITNTAKVANDGSAQAPFDFDLTNNTATFTVDARDADVAITKTVAPTPVGVGQPLTYTIKVTNNGPGVAAGVVVTDPLPSAVTFPTATSSQGPCTGTTTITCTIGTLAPLAVVTITIQVTPSQPGTFTNTVHVDTDSFDPDKSNNDASATVTITAADVAISKTAGPDPVAFGTTLTYTLTVHNNGPNRATGVTVRDTLPDGVALPTATPSQGTCFGSPTVTCVLGDLNPNLNATITIVVTPLVNSGTVTNTATVSSAFDLNSSNNTASVSTTVIEPRLDVTPDLGRPGFVPFAVGTDFPPNAPVHLNWAPGLGVHDVTADANGSFKIAMLIFPNDTQGPRQLVAKALQPEVPATNFLDTTTDFLVVPPTEQPFQVQPSVPVTKLVQRSG